MTITFRNVEGSTDDPVTMWPYEGLVAVLQEGLVHDWQPIVAEIRRSPWGTVARRVERFCSHCDEQALVNLFTDIVRRARERAEREEREEVAQRIRAAITRSGMTAADFAATIGTSASRLSTYATGKVMPSAAMLLRIEATAP